MKQGLFHIVSLYPPFYHSYIFVHEHQTYVRTKPILGAIYLILGGEDLDNITPRFIQSWRHLTYLLNSQQILIEH